MGKWNIWNDVLCPVLLYAKTLVCFTKCTTLTEKLPWRQHEESVVPWKSCLQKAAFGGCWLRQFQAVSLDVQNWTILNHRCFYCSIFGQNGLLQEKIMVVCFWLLHFSHAVGVCVQERLVQNSLICSLFDVFSTIDYAFHFYVYIRLWIGRGGRLLKL